MTSIYAVDMFMNSIKGFEIFDHPLINYLDSLESNVTTFRYHNITMLSPSKPLVCYLFAGTARRAGPNSMLILGEFVSLR